MNKRWMPWILLVAVLAVLLATAADPMPEQAGAADVELTTEDQKTLYALGMALTARLPKLEYTEAEMAAVRAGILDGLAGHRPRVDMGTVAARIEPFLMERMAAAKEKTVAKGAAFREAEAKKPGAETLDSGLVYFQQEAGAGASPDANDTVKIHYVGTFPDGEVFDSSRENDEPATFSLDGVVACFAQGLQKMKVGGKARFVCPPELAYGDSGSPPAIMPGATLVFEVELLEVTETPDEPGSASAAPPAGGAGSPEGK